MAGERAVALITGSSRGIGRAIAIALAGEGYDCVVNYARNVDAAKEVAGQIEKCGGRALVVGADISLSQDRVRLFEETISYFRRIDLLVNNAGVAPDVRAGILDASEESFDRVIGTNLKGPYFLTQLVARHMLENSRRTSGRKGKIVTISSLSAYAASTNRGDYCISKAGLSMMTQLFAARLAAHEINVYEVRPGIIDTDMTAPVKEQYDKRIVQQDLIPMHRWGTVDDVAKAVVAIAKDLLPFSTGQVIDVDGGFHIRRL